ncbi:MAG: SUMF1/EgtB/PvdO family nonheme iron enzyme [Anaerolineae bacterium]|nr:SUMF1/EgtB/PvdO family nonheme iron enzyme [Anaerolineae bacterium]
MGSTSRERDLRLWSALLGRDVERRREAARTIRALESERWYAAQLLDALPGLQGWQRANMGDALALLGDLRFSGPFLLSEMIAVSAGYVVLGGGKYPEERPRHTVHVSGFTLAQFPVTQGAYAVFVEESRHRSPRGWVRREPVPEQVNAPVVHVSARDAEAYCRWLSGRTAHRYRLPTEAEWVMAARGSADQRVYPWGDTFDVGLSNTWGRRRIGRLCAVGLFPEGHGPFGHGDMAGNVWEWCSSLYWPYPYRAGDGREDSAADDPRVMHGGSWRSKPSSVRCDARQGELPTDSFEVVGFRIARDG